MINNKAVESNDTIQPADQKEFSSHLYICVLLLKKHLGLQRKLKVTGQL